MYTCNVVLMEYCGKNKIGTGSVVFDGSVIGFASRDNLGKEAFEGAVIGRDAVIRPGTIIYCDVKAGDHLNTGHYVVIRENTVIGDDVSIGTMSVIEGHSVIGNRVNMQSHVYIPTNTEIGDDVFIGPNAVLTNDRYPPHGAGSLKGPVIKNKASIGGNSTIMPGVVIGEGALVAGGSVVTRDVPDGMLAVGVPARIKELPEGARR